MPCKMLPAANHFKLLLGAETILIWFDLIYKKDTIRDGGSTALRTTFTLIKRCIHCLHRFTESLQVQGSLLTLASQEKEDLIWKSTMFQLKSGTLKFMLNAGIDTLPTPANLQRWKYSSSDKCKLCGNRGTTNHYLNCCKVMLGHTGLVCKFWQFWW